MAGSMPPNRSRRTAVIWPRPGRVNCAGAVPMRPPFSPTAKSSNACTAVTRGWWGHRGLRQTTRTPRPCPTSSSRCSSLCPEDDLYEQTLRSPAYLTERGRLLEMPDWGGHGMLDMHATEVAHILRFFFRHAGRARPAPTCRQAATRTVRASDPERDAALCRGTLRTDPLADCRTSDHAGRTAARVLPLKPKLGPLV